MFAGCHEHVLDEKGRTSLPKGFRELLTQGEHDPWMTVGASCLTLYTAEAFDRLRARLAAEPLNDSAEALERLVVGHATPFTIDKQGRILVPPLLRRRARLDRDVVITGLTDRVEVWDRSRYETMIQNAQESWGEHSRSFRGAPR